MTTRDVPKVAGEVRILWLAPYPLWPAHGGGKLRTRALVSGVAATGARITVLYADEEGVGQRPIPGVTWHPYEPRQRTRMVEKGLSFLSRYHTIAWRVASEAASQWIEKHSSEFDIVIMEQAHMAGLQAAVRDIPHLVIDTQNVEHDVLRQIAPTLPRSRSRLRYRIDAAKCRRVEEELLASADRVIACSEEDALELGRMGGRRDVAVYPNGVDIDEFGFRVPDDSRGKLVVMTGTFDYLPNLDAAQWIQSEIWPEVRRLEPDAQFHLVGSRCPPELARLHSPITGFHVIGTVDDVRDSMFSARVFLMPLRMGGGTRLKALQAMSAGCPIVSTAKGVEGLGVTSDMAVLSEDAAGIAAGTVELLRNEAKRTAMAKRARRHVAARFSWKAITDGYSDDLRDLVARRDACR